MKRPVQTGGAKTGNSSDGTHGRAADSQRRNASKIAGTEDEDPPKI
jgi:hypothetical protein